MTTPRRRPARLVALTVALAVALVAVGAVAAAGGAARPGRDGAIAFVRDSQIWTIRADGRGLIQLTHASGGASHPAWSPDGSRIAYDSDHTAVYVANADGSDAVNVSVLSLRGSHGFGPEPCDSDPTWSPDAHEVAFTAAVDDCTGLAGGLYATTPTGHGRRTIEQAYDGLLGGDTQPAWAPSGRRLAFTRSDSLRMAAGPYIHDIYLLDPSSGKLLARLTHSGQATSPAWSPDGHRLALVDRGRIVIVGDGGRRERMLEVGRAPTWSPEGTRLVFVDSTGLELARADGRGKKLLLRCACSSPDWQTLP